MILDVLPEILYYENFNMEDFVSLVKPKILEQMLKQADYDTDEMQFLVDGFTEGFSLGYQGRIDIQVTAPNLKFRGIGNETVLWNEIMKEVKLQCYVGPFEKIPFKYYILEVQFRVCIFKESVGQYHIGNLPDWQEKLRVP